MQKHHVQIAIGVFIVVLLALFLFFALHTQDGAVPKAAATSTPASTLTQVKKIYSKGTYAISGTVEVPTPCYTLSAKSSPSSASSTLRVDLTVPPDTGVCLEEPVAKTFSVSVPGSKGLGAQFYLNGTLATTTN